MGPFTSKSAKQKATRGVSGFRKSSSFLIEDQPNYIINYKFSKSRLQAKTIVNKTRIVQKKKHLLRRLNNAMLTNR